MTDQPLPQVEPSTPTAASYTQRGNAAFEAVMASRTASQAAAFFLPHLRPGMHLLDVGCGPGAITLGFAQAVAPGEVVGVDLQASQVDRARAMAAERGLSNARFEVADINRLPFPDSSFDAVFAHAVLMHLREPVRALEEMRRVLRPGGLAGVRDVDLGASLFAPETPLLEQFSALRVRVRQHNGSNPFFGRQQRRCMLAAGFVRADAAASMESAGTLEETRRCAVIWQTQLQGFARTAIAERWMDQATVDAIAAGIDAWAERPDAFMASTWCEAVGWATA